MLTPKKPKAARKRNYRKEYDEYHAKPAQKTNRAARNTARAITASKGKVAKRDGKDVHHKDMNPRNNSPKNLQVTSASSNRKKQPKRSSRRIVKKV